MKPIHRKMAGTAAALIVAAAAGVGVWAVKEEKSAGSAITVPYNGHGGTFKNTLADIDTPDPSMVYKDGYYYMTFTHNGTDVTIMKSRTVDFKQALKKTVWFPDVGTKYSANLWAPEIQYIQGKWYIYFAADDGANENHRMYALEADSGDPMGSYTFKGQIKDATDKWAIDGLVMELEGKLYFVWSGWEGDVNIQQNTYIAPMSDPLTISGPRVLLSEPDLEWERAGGPPYINEGQSILYKDGTVHLVYSGAGSWTPFYSLGMLSLKKGADPLIAANWTKTMEPLLAMDDKAGVYGPGHNSFVSSPDGKEQWIIYHATSGVSDGWNNRKARAQKVTWDEQGMPSFGTPLSLDTAIPNPSGSGIFALKPSEAAGTYNVDLIPSSQDLEAPVMIHYTNSAGEEKQADIITAGGAPIQVKLPPTEGSAPGYAYAYVPLKQGMNKISITGGDASLSVIAVEIPRYEAEDAAVGPDGNAEENAFASGTGILNIQAGQKESVRFPQVNVPYDADYNIRLAIANLSGKEAKVTLRVEGGKKKTVTVQPTKRNDFQPVMMTVPLKSGANGIILEQADADLALDYIDVTGITP
ncbi:family 43 glycosylhydrolase [Paenibacillus gansuensis]|uniref:Family 43 glycosylhydrolase n=1 Tax=Paenibacillus gansuensis TaxID=306542 RepID=A0ABW5PB55_9BACL